MIAVSRYGVLSFMLCVGLNIPLAWKTDCTFQGGPDNDDDCITANRLARVSRGFLCIATAIFMLQAAQYVITNKR
jgi:hypothetical protein